VSRERTRPTAIFSFAAIGSIAVLTLAACSPSSGSSTASGSGQVSAMRKLTNPADVLGGSASDERAHPGGECHVHGRRDPAGHDVRYTLYPGTVAEGGVRRGGHSVGHSEGAGQHRELQQITQSMIGEGVKVLIINSIDPTSGIAVEQQAAAAGIQVIDYGRANLGG
jgi:hypothetical protein